MYVVLKKVKAVAFVLINKNFQLAFCILDYFCSYSKFLVSSTSSLFRKETEKNQRFKLAGHVLEPWPKQRRNAGTVPPGEVSI